MQESPPAPRVGEEAVGVEGCAGWFQLLCPPASTLAPALPAGSGSARLLARPPARRRTHAPEQPRRPPQSRSSVPATPVAAGCAGCAGSAEKAEVICEASGC